MFKVVFFFPIFVLLIITRMIIAEEKKCPEKLFDTSTCVQPRHFMPNGEFKAMLNRCLYFALGLTTADGGFIQPRTDNERVLIAHAKAVDECVNLIEVTKDDEDYSLGEDDDDKSLELNADYLACVRETDDQLLKKYDCSADS